MSAGIQLLQFGAKIEVEKDEISGAEGIRHLHLIVDRPASIFASVPASEYKKLVGKLSGSLSLQIGLPNLPPLLNIDAGQPRLPLDDAVTAIQRMDPGLQLRLNLSVAKGPLLAHWGINGGDHYMLPYLYSDGFVRLLNSGLLNLDRQLFATPERATLVVLEDSDMLLDGSLLSIAGLAGAKSILAGAKPLPEHTRRRLNHYRDMARDSLIWAGFQLNNITPAHFIAASQPNGRPASSRHTPHSERRISHAQNPPSTIQNRIAAHALAANVLYTADWSVAGEGDFEVGYAGADKTAVVNLPAGGETALDLNSLTRWAVWPFGGDCDQRLSILQNVSARRLPGKNGGANYAILQEQFDQILKEARWHHRHFLNSQIERNYKALHDLGDFAAAVSSRISAAIDSLTRGFTAALLGAVGVLILSLLAALLVDKRPELIFRAGLVSYAFYLLLFQGVYRMGSLLQDFRLLQKEVGARLAIFEQRLGRSSMAAAQAVIAASSRQFRLWFVITGVLLLLAAILLLLLAARLPGRFGMPA